MQEMRRTREGIGGMTVDREKKIAEIRIKAEFLDGCESKVEIDLSAIAQDYKFLLSELDREREESRKLREERDDAREQAQKYYRKFEDEVAEIFRLQDELQSAQQEIGRLQKERDKLIEVLRKLAKTNAENISEIREWKAKQNDPEVTDLDWYNYVARDILREVGVKVDV